MKKEFENDPLLQQLQRATEVKQAPKIGEDILIRATAINPSPLRKFQTPRLLVSLAGGAAVIALVSVGLSQSPFSDLALRLTGDQNSEMSASIAMGNYTFTEADLLARNSVSLAQYGKAAVGNYVSNHPTEYFDQMWQNHLPEENKEHWVFLVTDDIYIPNFQDEKTFFKISNQDWLVENYSKFATTSDAAGIRMLVQDNSRKLFPLVVPVDNSPGSFYLELRDEILNLSFTKVPALNFFTDLNK